MKFTASASATLLLAAVLATVALSRRTVDQEVMDLAAVLTNDVRQLEEDGDCATYSGRCSQYPCKSGEFNANPDAKCTAKRTNLITKNLEDAPRSYCCVKNEYRCDINKCKQSCADGTEEPDPDKFCKDASTCCKRKSGKKDGRPALEDTCPGTCSPPPTAACPDGKIDYTQVKDNGNYCQKSHGVCCVDRCQYATHVASGDSKKYTITGCRRSNCQAAELTTDKLFCRNGLKCCMKEQTETSPNEQASRVRIGLIEQRYKAKNRPSVFTVPVHRFTISGPGTNLPGYGSGENQSAANHDLADGKLETAFSFSLQRSLKYFFQADMLEQVKAQIIPLEGNKQKITVTVDIPKQQNMDRMVKIEKAIQGAITDFKRSDSEFELGELNLNPGYRSGNLNFETENMDKKGEFVETTSGTTANEASEVKGSGNKGV